jgi:hypothetical protein
MNPAVKGVNRNAFRMPVHVVCLTASAVCGTTRGVQAMVPARRGAVVVSSSVQRRHEETEIHQRQAGGH